MFIWGCEEQINQALDPSLTELGLGITDAVTSLYKVTNCEPSRMTWNGLPKNVKAVYIKGHNFIICFLE